jgi:putative radical SAM enzyme (TIGR03279 family)
MNGWEQKMSASIKSIEKDSPAGRLRIEAGDRLIRINGHKIFDVLDYKYYSYDARLLLELHAKDGNIKLLRVTKPEGADLGLEFDTFLMDKARSCANSCVFCFVDQLPEGMRDTLYFKDDDARLSFLQGNYITMTNLSQREIQRIIDMRISPINISVHSTDPTLRSLLLGNRNGGAGLEAMRRFFDAGITMNCQIVCCPGLNDGVQLQRSMEDLAALYPGVNSVSIVPVGLTKYREGLPELRPFDRELAVQTIRQVEHFADDCIVKYGSRVFFCADELYLKAGLDIPEDGFYEDYPQLENGVGMLRLLTTQFEDTLPHMKDANSVPFSIATGCAASELFTKLLYLAKAKCANINGKVYTIRNDFFGELIDVAGLITGGDLIRQLKGRELGNRLLIARNMLRHGESVFLDNVTLEEVARTLGVSVRVVEQDGADLARAMFGV